MQSHLHLGSPANPRGLGGDGWRSLGTSRRASSGVAGASVPFGADLMLSAERPPPVPLSDRSWQDETTSLLRLTVAWFLCPLQPDKGTTQLLTGSYRPPVPPELDRQGGAGEGLAALNITRHS